MLYQDGIDRASFVQTKFDMSYSLNQLQQPQRVSQVPLTMSLVRTNNATRASIRRSKIFASGTFKNVWQGEYIAAARAGQPCVAKEFKTGSVLEAHYFDEELKIIRRTQEILDRFHSAKVIDRYIVLNTPEAWTFLKTGVKNLTEVSLFPLKCTCQSFLSLSS
jgi:hypothetical protein